MTNAYDYPDDPINDFDLTGLRIPIEGGGRGGNGGNGSGTPSGSIPSLSSLRPTAPRPAAAPQPIAITQNARFAQPTYSARFSNRGDFKGQSVDDVASALRSGTITPAQVPVNVVVRNGTTFIMNTRSAQALLKAGIPVNQWSGINQTGVPLWERNLDARLERGLPIGGYDLW